MVSVPAIGVNLNFAALNSKHVRRLGEVIGELSRILHIPAGDLYKKAPATGDWAYAAHGLDLNVGEEIAKSPVLKPFIANQWVALAQESRRDYQQGAVGAQVVGFVNADGDRSGLEASHNRALESRDGTVHYLVGERAGVSVQAKQLTETPALRGKDIQLCINFDAQKALDARAAETLAQTHASSVSIVVEDPSSGCLFAIGSAPNVPSAGFAHGTKEQWALRPVQDIYEPGSAFKAVVFAEAIERGVISPEDTFDVPQSASIPDAVTGRPFTIRDSESHGVEHWTVRDILTHSSNVGTFRIAQKLTERMGLGDLQSAIRRFGFGRKTGIDFPAEQSGYVLPDKQWFGFGLYAVPIGLSVSATPLQMAQFYAAIANGGVLVQPHLVQSIGGRPVEDVKRRRIMSTRTAAVMRNLLRGPVDNGTAQLAQIPEYHVAGKTGTTPKWMDDKNAFCDESKATTEAPCPYEASFVGMVPAERPRFVTVVMVDDPKVEGTWDWRKIQGGQVAAPVFAKLGADLVKILGIQPTLVKSTSIAA